MRNSVLVPTLCVAFTMIAASTPNGGSATAATHESTKSYHSTGLLLVANKGEHTLGIIDPIVGKQIATVDEEGITGHEVAASPDGKFAVVPIYGNSGVGKAGTDGDVLRIIDLAHRKIVHSLQFDSGVR